MTRVLDKGCKIFAVQTKHPVQFVTTHYTFSFGLVLSISYETYGFSFLQIFRLCVLNLLDTRNMQNFLPASVHTSKLVNSKQCT